MGRFKTNEERAHKIFQTKWKRKKARLEAQIKMIKELEEKQKLKEGIL